MKKKKGDCIAVQPLDTRPHNKAPNMQGLGCKPNRRRRGATVARGGRRGSAYGSVGLIRGG
jgi:hypothetical protein